MFVDTRGNAEERIHSTQHTEESATGNSGSTRTQNPEQNKAEQVQSRKQRQGLKWSGQASKQVTSRERMTRPGPATPTNTNQARLLCLIPWLGSDGKVTALLWKQGPCWAVTTTGNVIIIRSHSGLRSEVKGQHLLKRKCLLQTNVWNTGHETSHLDSRKA